MLGGIGPEHASLNGTVRMADPDPGDTAKLAIIVPGTWSDRSTSATSIDLLEAATRAEPRPSGCVSSHAEHAAVDPRHPDSLPQRRTQPERDRQRTSRSCRTRRTARRSTSTRRVTSNGDRLGSLPTPGSGSVRPSVLRHEPVDDRLRLAAVQPVGHRHADFDRSRPSPTNLTLGVTIPQTTTGVTGATSPAQRRSTACS